MTGRIEQALEAMLPAADAVPQALSQAMRWAVLGGGKRIRPRVCLAAAVAAGGAAEDAVPAACAIELLHSYTLIHDDLPSMDNDVERRGRASVWVKFGEATAVLAGDALQALAFAVAARAPRNAAAVSEALARAACAVVRGQVMDLAADGDIAAVFECKTAALFMAAAEMGAWSVAASAATIERLQSYGRELGMAFQYEDDLLDGDEAPCSAVAVLGRDETRRRIAAHTAAAVDALAGLPGDVAPLVSLARRLATRES